MRSCIMLGLPKDLVQELNVGTVRLFVGTLCCERGDISEQDSCCYYILRFEKIGLKNKY